MEKDSPSKPSVAELAGRLKGHFLPMPSPNDELPFRRKPPCSLKLQNRQDNAEESDQAIVSPKPNRIKMKNSAIIEKLQANLALSPTALLPSPKSPEVKLQPVPLSPATPCGGPLSPTLRPSRPSSTEEEEPVSFDSPPEGTPLPCFNKTRARLSFKRRPPTRQHRRSAGEEAGAFGSGLSPCELCSPRENGDEDQVFASPDEEGEDKQLREEEEEEEDEEDEDERDCEKAERKQGNPAEEGGDAEAADGEQSGEALKDTEGGCPMEEDEQEEEDEDEEEEQNSM